MQSPYSQLEAAARRQDWHNPTMKNLLTACIALLAGAALLQAIRRQHLLEPLMRISLPLKLRQVLSRIGAGPAQAAKGAIPTSGLPPIVADVNKLRLDTSTQTDHQLPLLDLEAAE
jgi:hypothetical protein